MTDHKHPYHLLALVAAIATLAACSSSAGGSGPGAAADLTTPRPTTTATQRAVSHAAGRAVIRVSGALSIDASGSGAVCNYFYPAMKQGVAYSVSSTQLGASGGWDLLVSDDTGHNLSVVLNTDHGSWTGGRSIVGTVHTDPHLHHADFNVQLVKVIGQQHAQLSGHIDCP